MDLRVEMCEHLIAILEDQRNHGILFPMNQAFTCLESWTNIIFELGHQVTLSSILNLLCILSKSMFGVPCPTSKSSVHIFFQQAVAPLHFLKKFVPGWTRNSMGDGSVEVVQRVGHHDVRTWHHSTFTYGDTSRRKYTNRRSTILTNWNKGLKKKIHDIEKKTLKNVFISTVERFKVCIDLDSQTFEQYL